MNWNETSEPLPIPAMIDTHCHLDDSAFAGDLDTVLESSRAASVVAWILIGYAPDRWDETAEMAQRIPGMAHTLGVHPSHAQQWSPPTADLLTRRVHETGAVAIGEFGLDFYRDNAPYDVQREAMVGQLRIAHDLGLPAIFHMRGAEEEMLEVLRSEKRLPVMVFHSFGGTAALTNFILEHDAYVGVGGLATRQRSESLREELRRLPLTSMLLETDSPYLVPARQKDRRNVPAQVNTVAHFLAGHLGISVHDVARQTTANAERLFGRLMP